MANFDPCTTQEELEELCREWQKRLRIQDWRIRVRWANIGEMSGNDSATITIQESHPSALILIKKDEHMEVDTIASPREQSLIHELVHAMNWYQQREGHPYTQIQFDLMEQQVDKTAWALFEMKYGLAPGSSDNFTKVSSEMSEKLE